MQSIDKVDFHKTDEMALLSGKIPSGHPGTLAQPKRTVAPDLTEIEAIAQSIDDYLRASQYHLKIRVDRQTGGTIVKVVSKQDGRTIRQIPSEDLLRLRSRMHEMIGIIFDKKN
jgi:flagellar protein FlaG